MPEKYTVKVEETVVRLYLEDGQFERVICAGAVGAVIDADEVVVELAGGHKKIYSVKGFFIRNA